MSFRADPYEESASSFYVTPFFVNLLAPCSERAICPSAMIFPARTAEPLVLLRSEPPRCAPKHDAVLVLASDERVGASPRAPRAPRRVGQVGGLQQRRVAAAAQRVAVGTSGDAQLDDFNASVATCPGVHLVPLAIPRVDARRRRRARGDRGGVRLAHGGVDVLRRRASWRRRRNDRPQSEKNPFVNVPRRAPRRDLANWSALSRNDRVLARSHRRALLLAFLALYLDAPSALQRAAAPVRTLAKTLTPRRGCSPRSTSRTAPRADAPLLFFRRIPLDRAARALQTHAACRRSATASCATRRCASATTASCVWTSSWGGTGNASLGFGYTSSADLLTWSAQQFVRVRHERADAINVRAPSSVARRARPSRSSSRRCSRARACADSCEAHPQSSPCTRPTSARGRRRASSTRRAATSAPPSTAARRRRRTLTRWSCRSASRARPPRYLLLYKDERLGVKALRVDRRRARRRRGRRSSPSANLERSTAPPPRSSPPTAASTCSTIGTASTTARTFART